MYLALGAISLCTAMVLMYLRSKRGAVQGPKPPGPPKFFLIGNLLDIPRSREVLAYNEMADKYGDMVYLSVLNRNIFVISSAKILNDLFNLRSANYSDRLHSTMVNTLMEVDWIFALTPYGARWRETRKMFHSQLSESTIPNFQPIQLDAARDLLRKILECPEETLHHIHLHIGGALMKIAYAMDMTPQTANIIRMADDVVDTWSKVAVPGAYLVDILPILRFIPEWLLPGGGFQKDARVAKEKAIAARDIPFESVQSKMAEGVATPSVVFNLLTEAGAGADIDMMKSCAGSMYFAGTDAVSITLRSFVLAMTVYPDIQRKAQAELDRVVGRDCLPNFSHQNELLYCTALVNEVLRWNPAAPLGVPHVSVKDDHYQGYHIPARSIFIGNVWKIFRDPTVFSSPTAFNPERFMPGAPGLRTALDTLEAVFGPGRRICPGRFVARSQLFISMVSVLWAFDIGRDQEVVPDFTYGVTCHPLPWNFTIKPRGSHVTELLSWGSEWGN